MKRTRRFASWFTRGAIGDGVVVARDFEHPWYGTTASPAADLVTHWLHRSGVPIAQPPDVGTSEGELLCWYSLAYLDPRLGAIGLAIAAPVSDPARQRDAQNALLAWQKALGTRRVLLPGPPPGTLPAQRTTADRGVDIALAAQDYLDEGDSVLVLGAPTPPLKHLSARPRQRIMYADKAEALTCSLLHGIDGDRLSFVLSPDIVAEEAATLLRTARKCFPHLRGQQPDLWPYHASDRLNSLRLLLEAADELWLLTSAQPRHLLLETALRRCPITIREFTAPTDIEPHWLRPDLRTVALMTSDLSTVATDRYRQVITVLSGMGPIGVVTREVSTQITTERYLPTHV